MTSKVPPAAIATTASIPAAPMPASPHSNPVEDGAVAEGTATLVGVPYDRRLGLPAASLASAERRSLDTNATCVTGRASRASGEATSCSPDAVGAAKAHAP